MSYRIIKNVTLTNFQKHKSLEVEFDKGVNVIIGGTDIGKTAIFRAIRWCLFNRPSGDKYINRKATFMRVVVTFDDGLKIVRERGTKENFYEAYDEFENRIIHLEGFGVGPIDSIVNLHGMKEVDFLGEKQNLNLCQQSELPFFLGETPTSKAVVIGKIAKTEKIDLAVKNISSDIRERQALYKEKRRKIIDINKQLAEIKGLKSMENAIKSAQKFVDKAKELEIKRNKISEIVNDLNNKKQRLIEFNKVIEWGDDLEELVKIIDESQALLSSSNKIRKTNDKLNKNLDRIKSINEVIELKDVIELLDNDINSIAKLMDKSNSIDSVLKKINNLQSRYDEMKNLIDKEEEINELANLITQMSELKTSFGNIKAKNDELEKQKNRMIKGEQCVAEFLNNLEVAKTKYADTLKELKICPVCMNTISDEVAEKACEHI